VYFNFKIDKIAKTLLQGTIMAYGPNQFQVSKPKAIPVILLLDTSKGMGGVEATL